MNFPIKNESRQPFYKSQVTLKPQQTSPILKGSKINNFKLSFVPNSAKNQYQYQNRQVKDIQTNQKKYVKGYGHLLSPKVTKTNNSPLLTYRSAQNFSPRTVRQNGYSKQNQVQLEENRSVKFITKLRQEILSKNNINQCSRVTKKPQKVRLTSKKNNEKNMAQFLAQILKKQDSDSDVQNNDSCKKKRKYQLSDDSQLLSLNQSPERQTFEKKLIFKCKALNQELEIKDRQIQKLIQALKNLKINHVSQFKALQTQYSIVIQKKNSQIEAFKNQLSMLQSSIKITGKNKYLKQKNLQQQIQKYVNLLKQSQRTKNRMILQFENVLKEKLCTKQKSLEEKFKLQYLEISQLNKTLKALLQKQRKNYEQSLQEKDDLYEENKFLSLEGNNYTKWNQQLEQKIIFIQRKLNQSQKVSKKLKKQNQNLHQEINQLKGKYQKNQSRPEENHIFQKKLAQQIQTLRFENQSLNNQIDLNQKQYQKLHQTYLKQIQILETRQKCLNQENIQILEQEDFLRRQIFNLRSLVATLQQSLEENRMEIMEYESLKKQHQKELRQKSQIINNLKIQNIHKQSEVESLEQKSQQLQLTFNIMKLEFEKSKMVREKSQINSQQISQNEQSKKQNYQKVSQCLSRIQQLQNQLKQLINKFKRQKQAMIKKHLQETQGLQEKLKEIEKQNFNNQLSLKSQKENLLTQIQKNKQKIVSLEMVIQKADKQHQMLKEQISLKQAKIKQQIKTMKNMQAQHYQDKKRYQQNLSLKQTLYQQKIKNQQINLKQNVQKMILKIQDCLKESIRTISTKNTEKKNNLSNIRGENEINKFDLGIQSFNTPLKANSLSLKKKIKLQMSSPFDRNKKIDQSDEFQVNFVKRTQEIVYKINLLNKQINFYEQEISKIESLKQSQSLRVRQDFLLKVSELEKKLIEKQYELEKDGRSIDQMKRQKEEIKKQSQKLREQNNEKQKIIEQLKSTCERNKKLLDELEQKMQLKQREHKKQLRILSNLLEQCQAKIQKLQSQRQSFKKDNQSQNFQEQSAEGSSYYKQRESNYLMQIVQNRLEQIKAENQILSSQFQAINDQLQDQKQYIIELNDKIEHLQKENQCLENQNQKIKQALSLKQLQKLKTTNKIEKLQSQITQLQQNIAQKQQIIKAAHTQQAKINKLTVEKDKSILQLETKLQKSTKHFAQIQIKMINTENQLKTKQSQLQNLKTLNFEQNKNYTFTVENLKNQIKSQQEKQQSLKREFSNQINKIQSNHLIQTETLIKQNQQLIKNSHQQIINKQQQIQSYRQQISSLKAQIQQLHIQVEEWRFICQSNNLNKSLSFQIYQSKKSSIEKRSHIKQKFKAPSQSKPLSKDCSQIVGDYNQQPNFKVHDKNIQRVHFQVKNYPPKSTQLNLLDSIKSSLSFEQIQQSKKLFDSHNLQGDISFF